MIGNLHGKRVLVTGASGGLGASFVRFLAGEGARVAAAGRRIAALEALAAACGPAVAPVELDVATPEGCTAGVAAAAEALGGLDGLVNNAGAAWGGPALAMPAEEWRRVMAVNLDGVFHVAQAAARVMIDGGGGSIVNIASILSFGTGRGVAGYAASKAAVAHLTHALAAEWAGKGVRVNALAPGYIPTDMNRDWLEGPDGQAVLRRIPLRRLGRPEDLHGPLALLLSDAGSWMTGAVIPVDGGHLVAPIA
jgi:NAD(P)-dependent dehydrogenase (short-subunit alcohol dehydrogenase family)